MAPNGICLYEFTDFAREMFNCQHLSWPNLDPPGGRESLRFLSFCGRPHNNRYQLEPQIKKLIGPGRSFLSRR